MSSHRGTFVLLAADPSGEDAVGLARIAVCVESSRLRRGRRKRLKLVRTSRTQLARC